MTDIDFGTQLDKFLESDALFSVFHSSVNENVISNQTSFLVLDSSFNPPHFGHLELITRSVADHSHVILLVSVKNADKLPAPASFDHRLGMMYAFAQHLVETHDNISYSICVSKSPRFVDKSVELAQVFQGEMTYLLGFDTLIRVLDPKYYTPLGIVASLEDFMVNNKFICLTRNTDIQAQLQYKEQLREGKLQLPSHWHKGITMISNEKNNNVISSSEIRHRVENGLSIDDLTPKKVIDYITKHDPYSIKQN